VGTQRPWRGGNDFKAYFVRHGYREMAIWKEGVTL
jgi:hypothetical protein